MGATLVRKTPKILIPRFKHLSSKLLPKKSFYSQRSAEHDNLVFMATRNHSFAIRNSDISNRYFISVNKP